ncbi:hypothetical protein [Cohaesibacter intestini]|uniref:hypothetical protein n=1 Tax=Cohaesibacter intestini TaxID=2211145 RepID=UPI000DEAA8BC|nr:hypothetical protein [Cohaesibacter intestini]
MFGGQISKSFIRAIAVSLVLSGALMVSTPPANAYVVVKRFHQSAAPNREESDITVIRCRNGLSYYIYSYYRTSGPRYRVIIPPHWGKPVGGHDYHYFERAIRAACS